VATGPCILANVMSCVTVRVINMKFLNLTSAERYLGICTAPRISATKMKPQSLTSNVRFLDNDWQLHCTYFLTSDIRPSQREHHIFPEWSSTLGLSKCNTISIIQALFQYLEVHHLTFPFWKNSIKPLRDILVSHYKLSHTSISKSMNAVNVHYPKRFRINFHGWNYLPANKHETAPVTSSLTNRTDGVIYSPTWSNIT